MHDHHGPACCADADDIPPTLSPSFSPSPAPTVAPSFSPSSNPTPTPTPQNTTTPSPTLMVPPTAAQSPAPLPPSPPARVATFRFLAEYQLFVQSFAPAAFLTLLARLVGLRSGGGPQRFSVLDVLPGSVVVTVGITEGQPSSTVLADKLQRLVLDKGSALHSELDAAFAGNAQEGSWQLDHSFYQVAGAGEAKPTGTGGVEELRGPSEDVQEGSSPVGVVLLLLCLCLVICCVLRKCCTLSAPTLATAPTAVHALNSDQGKGPTLAAASASLAAQGPNSRQLPLRTPGRPVASYVLPATRYHPRLNLSSGGQAGLERPSSSGKQRGDASAAPAAASEEGPAATRRPQSILQVYAALSKKASEQASSDGLLRAGE